MNSPPLRVRRGILKALGWQRLAVILVAALTLTAAHRVTPALSARSPNTAPALAQGAPFTLTLDGSEARYRAMETFVAGLVRNEAIGRTRSVSGRVALDSS